MIDAVLRTAILRTARFSKGFNAAAALCLLAAALVGPQSANAQPYGYPANAGPAGLAPSTGIGPRGDGYYTPSQQPAPARAYTPGTFSPDQIVGVGHQYFGGAAEGLGRIVERAFAQYGRPNGYVLGQEAGGALIGGLRYGEGRFHTLDQGSFPIYWQGPSLGYDFGADGARTMVLLYNLPRVEAAYGRFGGVSGAAYLVGGVGMTALAAGPVVAVPIRVGVGARLGVNVGYLKFTAKPTWNPF